MKYAFDLPSKPNLLLLPFFVLIELSCLVIGSKASAQHLSEYHVRHFNDENGLPQSSVKWIAKDKAGFIWLITESGLVRFDGTDFRLFDQNNLYKAPDRFFGFQPAMNGNAEELYASIGYHQFFKIRNGRVQPMPDTSYYRKCIEPIPFVGENTYDVSLTSGSYNGLIGWLPFSYYIVPVSGGIGEFYLCFRDKIEYYAKWQKQSVVSMKEIRFINIFRLGKRLFYLEKNGKLKMLFGKQFPEVVPVRITGDILKDDHYVRGKAKIEIYWNNTAPDQAFFYLEENLYRLRLTADGSMDTELILKGFDLPRRSVKSILYDNVHKRIFIGCETDGLYELSKKSFRTVDIRDKETFNTLYAQSVLDDTTVMAPVGYRMGLDGKGKPFAKLLPAVRKLTAAPWYLLTDKSGAHWLRSDRYLVRMRADHKKMLNRWNLHSNPNGLYESADGTIWVFTENGDIFQFQAETQYSQPELFAKGPKNPICYSYARDTLWIGAKTGLHYMQASRRKFEVVAGTENFIVRSIYNPGDGRIWITTESDGFYFIRKGRLYRFPLDQDKFIAHAHCIFEDARGYFWIPTNRGLFQIRKDDLLKYAQNPGATPYYHYYSRESGFNTNEFNGGCQPCAVRLPSGYVSLPSIKGLVWFKPEEVTPEIPSTALFVDQVHVGGKPSPFSGDSLALDNKPEPITIKVATPYFGAPQNLIVSYAFQVEGESGMKWTPLDHGHSIHLTNLPSGKHILRIRKQADFQGKNIADLNFYIHVKAAWYETFGAKIGAVAALIGFVFFFIRLQSGILRKQNQKLEDAIEKRTESLNEALDALQDSENQLARQLRVQTRMIASLTHDVKTPLHAIKIVADESRKKLREQNYEAVEEISKSISESVTRVNALLDNTMTYIKVHLIDNSAAFESIDLHELVAQKFRLFALSAQTTRNELRNEVPVGKIVRCNPNLLGVLLNNLIDNAVKNTYRGSVTVSLETDEKETVLVISDTGAGIPADLLHWLNTDANGMVNSSQVPAGGINGVGLLMVKEISQMMGCRIEAALNETGTRIRLILPDRPLTEGEAVTMP